MITFFILSQKGKMSPEGTIVTGELKYMEIFIDISKDTSAIILLVLPCQENGLKKLLMDCAPLVLKIQFNIVKTIFFEGSFWNFWKRPSLPYNEHHYGWFKFQEIEQKWAFLNGSNSLFSSNQSENEFSRNHAICNLLA